MNPKIETVKRLAEALRELWPVGTIQLSVGNGTDLTIHNVGTNKDATEFMRSFGFKDRTKAVFDAGAWHTLEASADGVTVTAFAKGLPPSCHIEIYTEKVPKQSTIDTGEWIEIERKKVVCTGNNELQNDH